MMSPMAHFDRELEKVIRELNLRMVAPRLSEFDCLWEVTNKVCDRHEIMKAA
jgi:hypothetical protein